MNLQRKLSESIRNKFKRKYNSSKQMLPNHQQPREICTKTCNFFSSFFTIQHQICLVSSTKLYTEKIPKLTIFTESEDQRPPISKPTSQKMYQNGNQKASQLVGYDSASLDQFRDPTHIGSRHGRFNSAKRVVLAELSVHYSPEISPRFDPLHYRFFLASLFPEIN